ncbi:MAG TPA: GNAT family N-acetyltransferase [Candidatus Cybelea sp.]
MSSDALQGRLCRLRPYRIGDAEALCAVADDYLVARWMSRRFPNPYTRADADLWLSIAASKPDQSLVIEVDGVLAGGVGVEPLEGEREGTALFGYWLGRAYWGRGIGTDAARMVSDHALASGLRRLEASVFAQNVASARVLEKSGFALEARLRAWYLDREGRVCDALLFARLA